MAAKTSSGLVIGCRSRRFGRDPAENVERTAGSPHVSTFSSNGDENVERPAEARPISTFSSRRPNRTLPLTARR